MGANQSQKLMNEFSVPPATRLFENCSSNPVYQQGSNLTLHWLTNYTTFSLGFQQHMINGSRNDYTLEDGLIPDNTSYQWNIASKVFNFSLPAVYRFRLTNEEDDSQVIDSHSFNISLPKSTSTVSSTSNAFTTTLTSSAIYDSPTASQYNVAPAGGLSTGPAIGVGLGSAAFLAFIAILVVWLNRRKPRKKPVIGTGPNDYDDEGNYIRPLAGPSPTNSEQHRNDTALLIETRRGPHTAHSIKRKPLPGTASTSFPRHSIRRKPLPRGAHSDYDYRRNFSRPFEVINSEDFIFPLSMASIGTTAKDEYVLSHTKRVRFGDQLESRRYQISSPSTETDFGEDMERRLAEISGPTLDPRFSQDLDRRLCEISPYFSPPESVHGSIYNVSPSTHGL